MNRAKSIWVLQVLKRLPTSTVLLVTNLNLFFSCLLSILKIDQIGQIEQMTKNIA